MLRRDAGIAKGLLRRPGESVLAEVLRWTLRVHLDTCDSARAGAAAQHELMRVVEVVVKAQRIDTCTFKDRKIAARGVQWGKRGGDRCAHRSGGGATTRETCAAPHC